jgi:hypothetical protein
MKRHGTVDEYKATHSHDTFHEFWTVNSIVHAPEIPAKLYHIVDEAILKLDKIYIPFAWSWVRQKNRDTWRELSMLEEEINIAVMAEDETVLREALQKYYDTWTIILEAFRPIKDEYIPF